MRQIILALAFVLAVLAAPAMTHEVSAESPYCTLTAQVPTDMKALGNFSCYYATPMTTQLQVCLYEDNNLDSCKSGSSTGHNLALAAYCTQSGSGPSYFQTFVWIRDAYGNQETKWSALGYANRCYF